jgi:hypothetical protein
VGQGEGQELAANELMLRKAAVSGLGLLILQ